MFFLLKKQKKTLKRMIFILIQKVFFYIYGPQKAMQAPFQVQTWWLGDVVASVLDS